MTKAKHDAASYESCSYQREIFDGNALYDAFLKSKSGSNWKPAVQQYEMTYLCGLRHIQKDLVSRTYHTLPSSTFTLNERGHVRFITSEQLPDRIVEHVLCDDQLTQSVSPHLIHDNGASQKGKGIDFTRNRLLTHLRRYYMRNGSNEGYILLVDFSKYYDNIWHEALFQILSGWNSNENALWLLNMILKNAEVDVSYMTPEEFRLCMFEIFNSLEYQHVDKRLLTGELMMPKHMDIGNQVSQIAGIAYPTEMDNYIKIVKGIKFYARYMDDSYVMDVSKAFLEDLVAEIIPICEKIGIHVNTKKTRICKLSDYWRFLQIQYSLTETGRIIRKINPKRLTAMRRKMKKLCHVMNRTDFNNWYNSWFQAHYKIMSREQRWHLDQLYKECIAQTATELNLPHQRKACELEDLCGGLYLCVCYNCKYFETNPYISPIGYCTKCFGQHPNTRVNYTCDDFIRR